MRGHPFDDVRYTAPIWTENQNSLQDNWTDIGLQASNTNVLIIQEESRIKLAGHNVEFDTPETVTFPITHNACTFTIYLIIDAINKTYSLDVSPAFTGDNGNLATTYNVAFMTYEHGGGSVMIDANDVVKLYATDTPNIWENTLNYDSATKKLSNTINGVNSNEITIELAGDPQNLQQTLNLGSTAVVNKEVFIGNSSNPNFTPEGTYTGSYFRSDTVKSEIGAIYSGKCVAGAGNNVYGTGGSEAYLLNNDVGILVKGGSAHYVRGSLTTSTSNEIAVKNDVYLVMIKTLEIRLSILKKTYAKFKTKSIKQEVDILQEELTMLQEKGHL